MNVLNSLSSRQLLFSLLVSSVVKQGLSRLGESFSPVAPRQLRPLNCSDQVSQWHSQPLQTFSLTYRVVM